MKRIITCLLLLFYVINAHSQFLPDSVLTKYKAAKTDEEKGQCLNNYFQNSQLEGSEYIRNILNISSWFKGQSDEVGADYTDLMVASILSGKSDFSAALKMCFDILPRFEKRKDNFGIIMSNRVTSSIYFESKEYEEAAKYEKKELTMLPNATADEKAAISRT